MLELLIRGQFKILLSDNIGKTTSSPSNSFYVLQSNLEENTARAKTDVNTWDHAVARRSGLGGRGVHFPRGLIRMNLGSGRNSSELTIFFSFSQHRKIVKRNKR